ncbi:MAG: tRNA (guanosine(37)-N1)-methyltransferase TrmD [Tetrasphaera sp.]|nr:tRNA (guanosine(37)-N1)-methyltransferase TrmD [Tetrasphaera sp.]
MRIDVVTIFPEYLAPLDLSLLGRARRDGLLDIHVHDLRTFATDRHRTVDDSPFGGGAGMVMTPQPWAAALDAVVAQGRTASMPSPHLLVPGPGGVPFTQALARRLAGEPWLAFACGRYEGIDERVYEHAAARMPVTVVSLGDYVLNGGEVAVLAMVEAIGRLLPGVVGNAESLVEESHEDGLLEYPVYTRPAVWADGDATRAVPPVLLSGDHAAIAAWRHQQRLARTAQRRPDLLPASAVTTTLSQLGLRLAVPADAEEILVLQRACWVPEGRINQAWDIPPLVETIDDVRAGLTAYRTWVGHSGGRLVVSGRARISPEDPAVWELGRLMVAPDLAGRGIGRELIAFLESQAPDTCRTAWMNTGDRSERNLRIYRKAGYRRMRTSPRYAGTVELTKRLR